MNGVLGISTSCSANYMPLLRGWLESIKYWAPDVPICVVIHGEMETRGLEKKYGIHCIRQRDVKNKDLRRTCWGYWTKPVAFWEAPFDYVLNIDVDAVMWGDIRQNLPSGNWDVVHNEPHEVTTDAIQKIQYFDPSRIFELIKPFDLQGISYFNAGVICVRRGSLDLDEYLRMVEIQAKHPEVIVCGDQGILNILVSRGKVEQGLKVEQAHLQSCVPVIAKAELESRFQIRDGKPVPWVQPTVVHWAGPKPYTTNPDVFSLPMDYFREIGMREFGLPKWFPTKTAMQIDEFLHRDVPRTILNAKQTIKKVIGRK